MLYYFLLLHYYIRERRNDTIFSLHLYHHRILYYVYDDHNMYSLVVEIYRFPLFAVLLGQLLYILQSAYPFLI